MSNLVKFGSYTEEAAKAEAQELSKGGSDFMKLDVGKNVVRFLPPPVGQRSPFAVVHQHYVQLDGMTSAASFNCTRMMANRGCPVCSMVDKLRRTGNPVDYDRAGELLPRQRIFANVIDRKHPELGPRVIAYGKTIHKALAAVREDGDFTHPIDGYDIAITRKGTGKNDTEYEVRASRSNSKLAETTEQMNEWLSAMADVQQFARVPSDDQIRKILGLPAVAGGSGGGSASDGGRRATRTADQDVTEGVFDEDDDFPPEAK